MLALLLSLTVAQAAPHRRPPPKPDHVSWTVGQRRDLLVVKLAEGAGLRVEGGRVVAGPGDLVALNAALAGARPLFSRPAQALRDHARAADPAGALADLTLYLRLTGPDLAERGTALLADPRVETAYFAPAPQPPPADVAPDTPDLTGTQTYRGDAPGGFGFPEAARWPGATGAGVRIADLEYDWNPDHEDLSEAVPGPVAWGWDSGSYPCHGTMVVGVLVAEDNGYGMTGLVPDAEVAMVSPYTERGDYRIADAVDGAASLLGPGDVLLIEQQVVANGGYAPVEADPATFDAIALAVAAGVVVVEPGGNGSQDLDDPSWEGWFDRELRDSGAILVGGGAPPDDLYPARSWTGGSSHGSRVDVQGWYSRIASPGHSTAVDSYCPSPDLFFPDDPDQAYTSGFGGTSGASPLVTAVAAAAQGVALATRGEPWDPIALRAALVATGVPQQGDALIGPQPDLRALLRTYGVK